MQPEDTIYYRSFCPKDIEAIHQLLKTVGLYFAPIDDHPDWYEQKWRHDPSSVVVAHDGETLVGMVMFIFDPLYSVIAHLGVLPEYRKRGIARALLALAFQRIETKGGHYVASYIVHTNAASLQGCRSAGFEAYEQPLTAVYRTVK